MPNSDEILHFLPPSLHVLPCPSPSSRFMYCPAFSILSRNLPFLELYLGTILLLTAFYVRLFMPFLQLSNVCIWCTGFFTAQLYMGTDTCCLSTCNRSRMHCLFYSSSPILPFPSLSHTNILSFFHLPAFFLMIVSVHPFLYIFIHYMYKRRKTSSFLFPIVIESDKIKLTKSSSLALANTAFMRELYRQQWVNLQYDIMQKELL